MPMNPPSTAVSATRRRPHRDRRPASAPATCPALPVLLSVVILAPLFPAPLPAQEAAPPGTTPEAFDEVARLIRDTMAARGIPSVAVAAARDGRVVWEEAFGWADRAERRRATPHTAYSLASISKPMTATGLMTLVEDGRVELSDPVGRYLGRARLAGLAGDASGATVRRVLSHSAGLPLHYQFFYEDEGGEPPPRAETIRRYGALVFPPGQRFEYSNLGYGLLDHALVRVSGRGFPEFMRSEVFAPLGLTRTAVGLPERLEPHAATRYGPETQEPIPRYRFDHDGASAAWASAHDLIRFALFHLGHRPEGAREVLTAGSRRRMQRAATPDGEDTRYGLGWFVEEEFGHRKVWHTGSMPGVSTMLALFPEEDAAVVVLMNTLARDLRVEIQRRIAAALIPGYEEAWRREARRDSAEAEGGDEGGGGAGRFDPPPELVGTWTGALRTWDGDRSVRLEVRDDGDVHARVGDQLETVLNDPELEDGAFTGRMWGRLPTPDAARRPRHRLAMELLVAGDTLRGQLTAVTVTDPTGFALSSYLELTRLE